MKKALIPAVLLSLSMLSGCTLVVPASAENSEQKLVEAALSVKIGGRQDHDATEFLVGEFYISNGCTAFFDGHGTVTMLSPDGSSQVGSYALLEKDEEAASVIMRIGGEEISYRYQLISNDGGFTLTDGNGNMLVFVLRTYE